MDHAEYHSLVDTLRLYAGWLLACLAVIFALGSYQTVRALPYEFDLLHEWVESAVILRVAFMTFIFLLLSSVHRLLGGGVWRGTLLTIVGFAAIALFMANA